MPVLLTLILLALLAGGSLGSPDPPRNLRVVDVGEFSVNVSFEPSPTAGVGAYNVHLSEVNGTSVAELRPPVGRSSTLYDTVFLTASENISRLQPATIDPRFWFRNASQVDWRRGYESPQTLQKFVPDDFTHLSYRITGLAANVTVFIAVSAVGPGGLEDPRVNPVSAVPLAQPIPERPRNEGIYASWIVIIAAVLVAVALVARREARLNRKAYLYILPALLGLVALTFYPVFYGFYLSFTDRVGSQAPTQNFIGLENYVRVFATPDFALVTTTTVVWTVVNVLFHVTIGLLLAVLLNRRIRGRVVYRALLLLPWAVPSYITTLAWRGMFQTQNGLVNQLVGPFGWQVLGCGAAACNWLGTMPLALAAVIITNVWLGIPFMMMVFSGGLQGIPPELYEAADVDGLTPWQKFTHITLPLLKPTIVPAALLGFIWTFNMFNVIYLMTAGEPPIPGMRAGATDILITYVYTVGLSPPNEHGFAAAYSVVIFFMLLTFGLFYTRYTGALEAFAGRGEPVARRKARFPGARFLARVRSAFAERISNPVKAAMGPDQPEHVLIPSWLIAALVGLGALEAAYGALALGSMRFWFIMTVVHGTWFLVVGLSLLFATLGLALRQRGGRRIAAWTLVLELVGGFFAVLGTPSNPWNLRFLLAIVSLAFLCRPVIEYTVEPDPWTRLLDALARLRPARSPGNPGNPGPRKTPRRWRTIPLHIVLLAFVFFAILPVLVVGGTAFGEFPAMALQNVPVLREILLRGESLPGWTLENFYTVLLETRPACTECFWRWLGNSLLVSVGTTGIGLFLALTGGYAFSRFRFHGKRWSMLSFIVVQMFPGVIILIPYYVLFYQLGLIDTHIGLIVAYSVTALPFVVWFLKGFFDTIPVDLEEQAMVDGATRFGAFWRVIVPPSIPAIAVAALFTFLTAWNEWLIAFTFMTEKNYTLPVGVSSYIQPPQVFWNEFAAISILVSLPVVILFIVFQKYLVSGLTKGAVKG